MIPSCNNCFFGEKTTNKNFYTCTRIQGLKYSDDLCSQWEHKNKLIRKLWKYFNDE